MNFWPQAFCLAAALPAIYLPRMPVSEVISDGGSVAIGARQIGPSHLLGMIDPLDHCIGHQFPRSQHAKSPQIQASKANMLVMVFQLFPFHKHTGTQKKTFPIHTYLVTKNHCQPPSWHKTSLFLLLCMSLYSCIWELNCVFECVIDVEINVCPCLSFELSHFE